MVGNRHLQLSGKRDKRDYAGALHEDDEQVEHPKLAKPLNRLWHDEMVDGIAGEQGVGDIDGGNGDERRDDGKKQLANDIKETLSAPLIASQPKQDITDVLYTAFILR